MNVSCTIAIFFLLFTSYQQPQNIRKFTITGTAQGTTYGIAYYATDSIVTKYQADSLLNKIDSSLSIYKPYSLISQFNNSENGITIDDHFKNVVEKSIKICHDTKGIFDITVQPLVQAWGFGNKPIDSLPSAATIRSLKKCVNSKWLRIQDDQLVKSKPCVKIDVNGIAQGYSVDVIAAFLESNSIGNYVVELGGEIRVKGRKQPGNEKMRIGIEAPAENEFSPTGMQRIIELDSGAITTSGSYRKYYESEGKKITHIIDPRTGYPAQNELISVTVYAKDAITADAFDNALMVLGLKKALKLVEKRNDIAAHFIYRKENGGLADTASSRFYKLFRHDLLTLNMKKILAAAIILIVFDQPALAQSSNEWTNLFDGKTLNGWKKITGTAEYKIEQNAVVGISVAGSPNTFLVTEKEYGDFILELEVKIEDTTSNSGIQFRSHYDPKLNNGKGRVYGYQFELDPAARRWTGGVYDEARRDWLYPLSLNPSAQNAFKLNQYNKVRIECIGHTIKTWVNGTAAACVIDTMDARGFIALQVHSISKPELAGKKIYWRNIRIKTNNVKPTGFPKDVYVVNNIPNTLTDQEKENGYRLLFDGNTGNGWKAAYKNSFPDKGWEIKDGRLTIHAAVAGEHNSGGDIVTVDQFGAFDLSFDFKLTEGANSGLKYFVTVTESKPGSALGLEYQLIDDQSHPDAKAGIAGNRALASLYDLIAAQKTNRFVRAAGQWNKGRIIVYPNNKVEHYLNGVKVLEYERGSKAYRDLVAISKYKDIPNFGESKQGHILLQDHGNQMSFRSIKIRELK